jgi:hypothetical protein
MPSEHPKREETPFERFKRFTAKIVSVPHSEIKKREAEWKNGRKIKSHHRRP